MLDFEDNMTRYCGVIQNYNMSRQGVLLTQQDVLCNMCYRNACYGNRYYGKTCYITRVTVTGIMVTRVT